MNKLQQDCSKLRSAVVDPGFPRREAHLQRWGLQPISWQHFSQKLHENQRDWTGGARPKFPIGSTKGPITSRIYSTFTIAVKWAIGCIVLSRRIANSPTIVNTIVHTIVIVEEIWLDNKKTQVLTMIVHLIQLFAINTKLTMLPSLASKVFSKKLPSL